MSLRLKPYLLIIALTFFNGQVFARPDSAAICMKIHDGIVSEPNDDVLCSNIMNEFETTSMISATIFNGLCVSAAVNFRSTTNSQIGLKTCKQQMDLLKHTSSEAGDSSMSLSSASVHFGEGLKAVGSKFSSTSRMMASCDEVDLYSLTCFRTLDLVIPDLKNLMSVPIVAPAAVSPNREISYTKNKCDCLEDAVRKNNTFKATDVFNKQLEKEKQRINDVVFDAAGKKIINNFAANLEDVNFYQTNNVDVLGGDAKAKQFQCNDIEEYRKKITEACARNGVSPEVMNTRSGKILSSFGDFTDEKTLEDKFVRLQKEILNAQLDPSKIQPGGPASYSRDQYDRVRFGVAKKREEVKFMSEVTNLLLHDDSLNFQIEEEMSRGKKPGHAIMQLLKDENNPGVTKFLTDIVKKHPKNTFYKNLGVALKSKNSVVLNSFLDEMYDMATDMHPGLRAIFRNVDLFQKARSRLATSNDKSLITIIDNDPNLLKDYFQKRCSDIEDQFSEAICVKGNDFVSLTNRDDLNKLLNPMESQLNPVLKDLILCRVPLHSYSGSIFSKISFSVYDKLSMADYFKRKVNPKGGISNRFDKFAAELSSGGSNSVFLSEMSKFGGEMRKPAAGFASKESKTETKIENEFVAAKNQPAAAAAQERADQQVAIRPALTPNYASSSMTAPKEAQSQSKESREARASLKELFSNEMNKKEASRFLSNISKDDQDELQRLKDEIESNNDKFMALRKETNDLKMNSIRKQIDDIETQERSIKAGTRTPAKIHSDDTEEISSAPSTTTTLSDKSKESQPAVSRVSGSGSIASASIPLPSASSNSDIELARSVQPASVSSDRAEILVQSSGSTDASKEVISFVNANEPDLETLKQLKSSGMTFKYRVLENGKFVEKEMKVDFASLSKEAKDFLDKKIELKEAKRRYSYNALKLILVNQIR